MSRMVQGIINISFWMKLRERKFKMTLKKAFLAVRSVDCEKSKVKSWKLWHFRLLKTDLLKHKKSHTGNNHAPIVH